MTSDHTIIATVRKGARNFIVVTATEFGQRLHFRQHEPNGKRELVATDKAIGNLDLPTACELAAKILHHAAGFNK